MGRLTTHVLDTANGIPAANVAIELWRLASDGERSRLKDTRTTADGRTPSPLLEGDEMAVGVYELVFAVGAYFARRGLQGSDPPFLDRVPVRFGIANPAAHYHVPLLVSPWAYSTYRGS
ncbi:MAG TPA: hydroxyisourate hydrolase [Ktedonobacterales bacterium]|nr:hydroxyisourate hydrolase [Ktedonobacterales bacterium]